MAYWLVKSEPSAYSWQQFVKEKKTQWTGIRNYAARLNLYAMKKGDLAFFYHSNEGLEIVGIAQITKEFYPDTTTDDDRWCAVDIKPIKALAKPVGLAVMKKNAILKEMPLVKISRLSVCPVTEEQWHEVLRLAE